MNKKFKLKKPFNIGDKVKLKSGGPKMTVEDIYNVPQEPVSPDAAASKPGQDPALRPGEARCSWFGGYNVKSYVFRVEMLRRIM